jgi:flagellar basal body-associated protein FliL
MYWRVIMEQSDANKEVSYIKDCLVEWISNFEFKPLSTIDGNTQLSKDITLRVPINIVNVTIHLNDGNPSITSSDST